MTRSLAADRPWPSEAMEAEVLSRIPLGRFGIAEEVADLIVWLASDASAWLTGTVLVADGGWSLPRSMVSGLDKILRRCRSPGVEGASGAGGAPEGDGG